MPKYQRNKAGFLAEIKTRVIPAEIFDGLSIDGRPKFKTVQTVVKHFQH